MNKFKIYFSASLILFLLSVSGQAQAQTISNISAGYNVERGVIEISYDLEGQSYQGFSVSLKLKQIADDVLIDIPAENISPSLDLIYPGARKKVEVSIDGLTLDGEFIPIFNAVPIAKPKPLVQTALPEPEKTEVVEKTSEPNVASDTKEEVKNVEKTKSVGRYVRGFIVTGASWADLGNQIKQRSEEFMSGGNLQPVNVRLNLAARTFSCDFVESETGLIKLGLYFGPEKDGCVSCQRVLERNPSSKILRETSFNKFVFNLIAIHNN
jgi:hypothetical protein